MQLPVWSTLPLTILDGHVRQTPKSQSWGKSIPASNAAVNIEQSSLTSMTVSLLLCWTVTLYTAFACNALILLAKRGKWYPKEKILQKSKQSTTDIIIFLSTNTLTLKPLQWSVYLRTPRYSAICSVTTSTYPGRVPVEVVVVSTASAALLINNLKRFHQ